MQKTGLGVFFLIYSIYSIGNEPSFSILYLNSYHKGYQWTDRCFTAFKKSLKTPTNIHTYFLDSKRQQDNNHIEKVTKEAMDFIERNNPDLIVAAEDNASKYIIQPFFKNHTTPILFLGVNVDASIYNYPYTNATGIIEMDGIGSLISALKTIVGPKSIGMIFSQTNTSNKVLNFFKKQNLKYVSFKQVDNAQEWYQSMNKFNADMDFIALDTITGIKDLNHEDALDYIINNIHTPILTASSTSRELAHIGYINLPEEHGIWVANRADEILQGADISSIPIRVSSQYLMFINYDLVKKMHLDINRRIYQLPHTDLKNVR